MNAHQISQLLEKKHAEDLYIPECKNGPTHGNGLLKLDGWAMKKSWANPLITGYEIKVSRSDFLRDDKWQCYLEYCNQFYWVCPHGLIRPEEISQETGLIYVSKTGTKLYTKKKSPYREINTPSDVYKYILMCRVKVDRQGYGLSRKDQMRNWLFDANENKNLGHLVSKRISEILRKTQSENVSLKRQMETYKSIRERITELGFNPEHFVYEWDVKNKLNDLCADLPPGLKPAMDSVINGLQKLKEMMDR